MAPVPLHSLVRRDGSSLSAGAIAGIIVGIVVVAGLLLGLLIWRLLAYRKNLDPYSAKSLDSRAREKALSQTRGEHVRSTRPRDRYVSDPYDDETGLVTRQSRDGGNGHGERVDHGARGRGDADSMHGTVHDEGEAQHSEKMQRSEADNMRRNEADEHTGAGGGADPQPTISTRQAVLRGCTTM